jgi:hypothetical protein
LGLDELLFLCLVCHVCVRVSTCFHAIRAHLRTRYTTALAHLMTHVTTIEKVALFGRLFFFSYKPAVPDLL